MNRAQRRASGTQAAVHHTSNDFEGPATSYEVDESIKDLLDRAEVGMLEQSAKLKNFVTPASDMVLMVLDGTSPLAPPQARKQGKAALGVRLMHRIEAVSRIRVIDKDRATELDRSSPCGHLEYFATTALGGKLSCMTCELKISLEKSS